MREYLFIFEEDSVFSEIKIRANTEREAKRFLNILVKVAESEIKSIRCLND